MDAARFRSFLALRSTCDSTSDWFASANGTTNVFFGPARVDADAAVERGASVDVAAVEEAAFFAFFRLDAAVAPLAPLKACTSLRTAAALPVPHSSSSSSSSSSSFFLRLDDDLPDDFDFFSARDEAEEDEEDESDESEDSSSE